MSNKLNLTPQTYIDMNKEFVEEGYPFEIAIPTQEAIDKWLDQPSVHHDPPPPVDLVAEMWKKHREEEIDKTFDEAMNAPTIDDALVILESKTHSSEDWTNLSWAFAFNNGNTRIPPSEREDALASFCLDKSEEDGSDS